ncbi:hypothetical protein FN846DRAFT_911397 [Sphaerosporella brunnea]|uniref:Uncharacterized protein n=1 Tax=Sphaerosporella brunnea TaxID=1250544 RepID=A0A5J5EKL6_9PEZI|nr:hypothetical protein FN846DRAFT_911397 [Sphaerosporella brunnea]
MKISGFLAFLFCMFAAITDISAFQLDAEYKDQSVTGQTSFCMDGGHSISSMRAPPSSTVSSKDQSITLAPRLIKMDPSIPDKSDPRYSEYTSLVQLLSEVVSRTSAYTTITGYRSMMDTGASLISSLRTRSDGPSPPGTVTNFEEYYESYYEEQLKKYSATQTFVAQSIIASISDEKEVASYIYSRLAELTSSAAASTTMTTTTGTRKGTIYTAFHTETAKPAPAQVTSGVFGSETRISRWGAVLASFVVSILVVVTVL